MESTGVQDRSGLPGVVNVDPDYRLRQEVKILYELLPMAQWVHLIAAVLLFSILLQYVSQETLTRWFGFFLLIIFLRVIISIYYRKATNKAAKTRLWFNLFLAGTALYGVMWSGTAIYLVPSESAVITGFTGLLLCGLAAGSVAISSVNMKVFMVYAISTLWPYAALLIASGQNPQVLVGWLMMLYFIIIMLMSVQVNRYFADLIMLELRTSFLEDQVRHENHKRQMIEKAMLENTLEEELGEQIRRQAKSLRNELSGAHQISPGLQKATNLGIDQLVTYKPYLDKFNSTVISQINSARDILTNFNNHAPAEEQQKRISVADKILNDIITVIGKLNIDEAGEEEELDSIQIQKINLHQLLIYIAHEIPLLYKSKFITIKRHVENDVPKYVFGDRNILREILQKLVLNSFQYSDGGIISIKIRKESEDENEIAITFEVEDTGVGIPAEVVDEFLKDSQPDSNDKSGLTAVKHYVQALGGKVFVNSVLGVGSTVGFTLSFLKEGDLLEI